MKHIMIGNLIEINNIMYEIVSISDTKVNLCFIDSNTRQWKKYSICIKQLADFLGKAA